MSTPGQVASELSVREGGEPEEDAERPEGGEMNPAVHRSAPGEVREEAWRGAGWVGGSGEGGGRLRREERVAAEGLGQSFETLLKKESGWCQFIDGALLVALLLCRALCAVTGRGPCPGFRDEAGGEGAEVRHRRPPPAPHPTPGSAPSWTPPRAAPLPQAPRKGPGRFSPLQGQSCTDSNQPVSQGPGRSGASSRHGASGRSACPVGAQSM